MMDWLRLHHSMLDSRKVQQLPPDMFKVWVNVLCLASQTTPRGTLPEEADIAFRLRMEPDEAHDALAYLHAHDLLEFIDDGWSIHDWDQWQYDKPSDAPAAARDRKRRSRAADTEVTHPSRDVTRSLALDTDSDTDSDTEQTQKGAVAPPAPDIEQTVEILHEKGWFIEDTSVAIEAAVVRSFRLVPQFLARDGPLEAEKFCRYYGAPKKRPMDWYRAWLNWLKRAVKEQVVSENGSVLTGKEKFQQQFGHLANVHVGQE